MFSASALVKTEQVMKFDGVVWGFDFLDQYSGFASLRSGELYHFDLKSKKSKLLMSPKVKAGGQGGLLDLKVVKIKGKTFLYYTYSKQVKDLWTTAMGRALYKDGKLSAHEDLFVADVVSDTSRHFGSRMAFKDQFVYVTIGDRGERKYAQDLSKHNGSIVRLHLDGSIPKDNPFGKKNQLKSIWSWGHRNPQGIDFDPVSRELFSCEFGPRGGDEFNHIKKALNYGWPVITYGKEYWGPSIGDTHKKGMEQPVVHWSPSISPSGMVFYRGDKVSEWKGNVFLANLGSRHLRRLVLSQEQGKFKVTKQESLLSSLKERIRHVANGKDGHLYISTDSGKIIKVFK